MEPAPQEIRGLEGSVDSILEWAVINGDFRTALLGALGIAGADPPRSLAGIDEEDITEVKRTLKLGDDLLRPGEKAKVVTAWRAARIITGAVKSQKQLQEEDIEAKKAKVLETEKKIEILKAQCEATKAASIAKGPVSITNGDTINLSEILDQTSTQVAIMMTIDATDAAREKYEEKVGGRARPTSAPRQSS